MLKLQVVAECFLEDMKADERPETLVLHVYADDVVHEPKTRVLRVHPRIHLHSTKSGFNDEINSPPVPIKQVGNLGTMLRYEHAWHKLKLPEYPPAFVEVLPGMLGKN